MSFSHSLPQVSHPFALSLANNSILGKSPKRSTILSLVTPGFLECLAIGSNIAEDTPYKLPIGA